jgi:uncharacterized protein DUF1566
MLLPWAAGCSSREGDAPASARFVVLGAQMVRDAQTGLEWTRHDDGTGLDWDKAEAYCRSLSIDDVQGWRLPRIEELQGLYGAKARIPCGDVTCAIDSVFTLTSPYVWTSTARGPGTRMYLDFRSGTQLSPTVTPRLVRRVLCVRTSSPSGAGIG